MAKKENKVNINDFAVIMEPVVTEKTMKLTQDFNKVTVKVAKNANKVQIKEAFERLFGVNVVNVTTCNIRGKAKRVGRYEGTTASYKRAIITLKDGESLDLSK